MNPFDWESSPKSIDWSDVNRSNRISSQSTEIINRKRASGTEPGILIPTSKHITSNPKKFALKKDAKQK